MHGIFKAILNTLPVRTKAFDYHIVTLAFPNAFAPVGRTPTYILTHGDAMGFMLLGFQPVIGFWARYSLLALGFSACGLQRHPIGKKWLPIVYIPYASSG